MFEQTFLRIRMHYFVQHKLLFASASDKAQKIKQYVSESSK